MKKNIAILLIALGLLSGCSSKSDFYQLHPKSAPQADSIKSKRATVIGIAEVEVAEYLRKSEVVTRLSAGRVNVHDKALWAGSLAQNIQTVLAHNISTLLPHYTFLTSPWEEPIDDKYRIYVTIDRFDGYENGKVTLQGRWSLVDKAQNSVLYSESVNYTAQGGKTLDEIVDTQSRLIDRLSRRIASRIRTRI
ncbi:PqiC family protein [Sulfurovum sp. NBC37-1]|uniref:PqiC family protein n=1 Tax=Sulfurovum sp. (strain NBC37-1) TaxID=387093 RepID=UPI0001587CC4|nr:PqiC family protein [Sulfurovum sp. NBC37-1]BAF72290.1 conserved hypothetical protein [Sulfurovum sp. NBC37-1]